MSRENTLYDFPPEAVTLANQPPECIAESILRLLDKPATRAAMSQAGTHFMADRPLSVETDQFRDAVERVLKGDLPGLSGIERLYTAPAETSRHYVGTLPASIQKRLSSPPNAYVNSLPPRLRRFVGWGARVARRLLENR